MRNPHVRSWYRRKSDGVQVEAIKWSKFNYTPVVKFMGGDLWSFDRSGNLLVYTDFGAFVIEQAQWVVNVGNGFETVPDRLFVTRYEEI